MNTDGLKLPMGGIAQGRFIDGMREVWTYDICLGALIARWDTMIGGQQRTVEADPLDCGPRSNDGHPGMDDWLTEWRSKARKAFEAQEQHEIGEKINIAAREISRNG